METIVKFLNQPIVEALSNLATLVVCFRWLYLERWKSKLNPYFIQSTSGKKITMYSTEDSLG